jgi:hypothetical protein
MHHLAPLMSEMGQWQVLPRRNIDGRFTSESSRNSDKVALTLSANNRHPRSENGCVLHYVHAAVPRHASVLNKRESVVRDAAMGCLKLICARSTICAAQPARLSHSPW